MWCSPPSGRLEPKYLRRAPGRTQGWPGRGRRGAPHRPQGSVRRRRLQPRRRGPDGAERSRTARTPPRSKTLVPPRTRGRHSIPPLDGEHAMADLRPPLPASSRPTRFGWPRRRRPRARSTSSAPSRPAGAASSGRRWARRIRRSSTVARATARSTERPADDGPQQHRAHHRPRSK